MRYDTYSNVILSDYDPMEFVVQVIIVYIYGHSDNMILGYDTMKPGY